MAPPAWAIGNHRPTGPREIGRQRAVLEAVTGTVEIRREGAGAWTAAANGVDVGKTDEVRTGERSSARLRIGDVGVVEMSAATEIRIRELHQVSTILREYLVFTRPTTQDEVNIEIVKGETRQSFAAREGRTARYLITTPDGVCEAPPGAIFSTRVDESKATPSSGDTPLASAFSIEGIQQCYAQAKAFFFGANPAMQMASVANSILQGGVIGATESIKATQGTITIERKVDKFVFTLGTQTAELGIDDVSSADGSTRTAYDGRVIAKALQSKNATLSIAISGAPVNSVATAIDKLINPPTAVAQPAKLIAVVSRGATAGANFGLYLSPQFQDANGNEFERPSGFSREVTVSKVSGPGDLKGATTMTVGGDKSLAGFSGLSVEKAGTYVLKLTSGSLSAEATIVVVGGFASKLVILTQPAGAEPGKAFTTQPTIGFEDKYGNATKAVASVTVAIVSVDGKLISSSTTTEEADIAAGNSTNSVTFKNLGIDKAGTYTLTFTTADGKLTSVTSNSFTVAEAAQPAKISASGLKGAGVGADLAPYLVVSFQDKDGNDFKLPANTSRVVTVSKVSGPGDLKGATTATVAAGQSEAQFTGLTVEKIGTYKLKFSSAGLPDAEATLEVGAGPMAKLVILTQPAGAEPGKVFATQPRIAIQDKYGNAVSGIRKVKVEIASGEGSFTANSMTAKTATIGMSGAEAVFTALAIDKAGTYTLKFTVDQLTVTSASFTVAEAAKVSTAKKLKLLFNSTAAAAGAPFSGQPTIGLRDANNKPAVNIPANTVVTVELVGGGAELKGTKQVTVSSGQAEFTGLRIDKVGTYTLRYTSPGLDAVEEAVTVVGGAPAKLEVVTQPAGAEPGKAFTTQPKLKFTDAFGNPAKVGYSMKSTVINTTIASGSGTLSGKTENAWLDPMNAEAVGAFTDLAIDKSGTYTLKFTSPDGTLSATSASFTVGTIKPAKNPIASMRILTVEAAPWRIDKVRGDLVVDFLDASGDPADVAANTPRTVMVIVKGGTAGLKGTTTQTAKAGASGVTFSDLAIDKLGSHMLVFSSPGLPDLERAVKVAGDEVAKIEIVTQPSGGAPGQALTTQPKFRLVDGKGNPAYPVSKWRNVKLSIASGPGNFLPQTSGDATFARAGEDGFVTFQGIGFDKAGTYTIKAVVAGSVGNAAPMNIEAVSNDITVASAMPVASKLVVTVEPAGAVAGRAFTTQPKLEFQDENGKVVTSANFDVQAVIRVESEDTVPNWIGTSKVTAINGVVTFKDLGLDRAGTFSLYFHKSPTTMKINSTQKITIKVEPTPVAAAKTAVPSAAQIGAMTPEEFAKIPAEAFGKMTMAQYAAIKPEHFKVMTNEQFKAILDNTNVATAFTATQIAAIKPEQIKTLPTAHIAKLTDEQLKAMTKEQAEALTENQLATLSAEKKKLLKLTEKPKPVAATKIVGQNGVTNVDGRAGTSFGVPSIVFQDEAGNVSTNAADQSRDVTVAIVKGDGALQGTTKVKASGGLAQFGDLRIDKTGSHTLRFSSPGLTDFDLAVTISGGDAAKTVILTQPIGAEPGKILATQPKVEVQDAFGNRSSSLVDVVVAIASGDGTLGGTTKRGTTFTSGNNISFDDLTLDKAGSFTLKFTIPSFPSVPAVMSNSFTVAAPKPAVLTAADFTKMTPDQIAALTPDQFKALPADAFENLTEAQIKAFSSDQIKVMTSAQTISFKNSAVISAIFTPAQIAAITPENLKLYQKTQISRMSDEQLKALTADQLAALTTEQKAALSNDQKILLGIDKKPEVATKLAITSRPSSVAAGATFDPKFAVAIQSASGTTMTSSTVEITASVASGPGVLLGTAKVSAKSGVATFGDLKIEKAGKYTVKFTATGLTEAVSTEFEIKAGDPVKAVIVYDNLSALPSGITGALASSGGGGPSVSLEPPPTQLARATNSDREPLIGGAPIRILSLQTTTQIILQSLISATDGLTVEYQDAFGNRSTSTNGAGTVTINGKLLNVTIVNGRATISASELTAAGIASPYTLNDATFGAKKMQVANVSASTAASTVSASTPKSAVKLSVATAPAGAKAGEIFTTQPVIEFRDASGSTIVTDSVVTATVSSGSGKILGSGKAPARGGKATFSDLAIEGVGSQTITFSADGAEAVSSTFDVAKGPEGNRLVFTMCPTLVGPGKRLDFTVAVMDANGHVTDVGGMVEFKLREGTGTPGAYLDIGQQGGINMGGYALGGGSRWMWGNSINMPGTGYVIEATFKSGFLSMPSIGGFGGGPQGPTVASGYSPPIEVKDIPATKLGLANCPSSVAAGAPVRFALEFQGADGNLAVPTEAQQDVTVTKVSGPGEFKGTATLKAEGSFVTFSDLTFAKSGDYVLKFSAPSLTAVEAKLSIAGGPASALEIATEPVGGDAGTALATQPSVKVVDAVGNPVSGVEVTAVIAAGDGTLSGSTKATSADGVATFSGLAIDNGGKFTLSFASGSLKAVTSKEFEVKYVIPTPAKIGTMTADEFAKIPPEAFAKMTQKHFDAFKPEQIKVMTTAQFAVLKENVNFSLAFKPAQVAAFPPEHIKNLQPEQFTGFSIAQLKAMTKEQIAALTDEQKKMLSQEQKDALGLKPPPIGEITVEKFAAMTPAEINKLSAEDFKKIPPAALGSARMAQIVAFTAAQIKGMSDDQFTSLKDNPEFFKGLIYLKTDQIAAFKPEHIKLFSVEQLKRLKPEQLKTMTSDQVAALTDEQKTALGSKLDSMAKPPAPAKPSAMVPAGEATKLGFAAMPKDAKAGEVFSAVAVEVRDKDGKKVTTSTAKIALILYVSDGTRGGIGTAVARKNVDAVAGVATFTDFKADTAGKYHFIAISSPLNQATSEDFDVAGSAASAATAAATKLAITAQPTSATAGELFDPKFTVAVQDASGMTVTTATNEVTASIVSGPVRGTAKVSATNGVATFSNLKIEKAGTYKLKFTSGSLTEAVSAEFEIKPGAPVKAVIIGGGTTTSALPSGVTGTLATSGGGGPGADGDDFIAARSDLVEPRAESDEAPIRTTSLGAPVGLLGLNATSLVLLQSLIAQTSGSGLQIEYQDAHGNRSTSTNGSGTVTINGVKVDVTITNGVATIDQATLTQKKISSPFSLTAATAGATSMTVVNTSTATGGVSGELERTASSTPAEKITYASNAVTEMTEAVKTVSGLLETARKKGDADVMQCLNNRLTALKALLQVSEAAQGSMKSALESNNSELADHEFRKIAVAIEKTRQLLAEAQRCGASSTQYTNNNNNLPNNNNDNDNDNFDFGNLDFALPPEPASKLVLSMPPSSLKANQVFSVTVTAQAADGSTDATFAESVHLSLSGGTGKLKNGGIEGGAISVNADKGVASFSNLAIGDAGTTYVFTATSTAITVNGSPVTGSTAEFAVTSAASEKLNTSPTTGELEVSVKGISPDATGGTIFVKPNGSTTEITKNFAPTATTFTLTFTNLPAGAATVRAEAKNASGTKIQEGSQHVLIAPATSSTVEVTFAAAATTVVAPTDTALVAPTDAVRGNAVTITANRTNVAAIQDSLTLSITPDPGVLPTRAANVFTWTPPREGDTVTYTVLLLYNGLPAGAAEQTTKVHGLTPPRTSTAGSPITLAASPTVVARMGESVRITLRKDDMAAWLQTLGSNYGNVLKLRCTNGTNQLDASIDFMRTADAARTNELVFGFVNSSSTALGTWTGVVTLNGNPIVAPEVRFEVLESLPATASTPPTISAVSPGSGVRGTQVVATGTGFTDQTTLAVGGVAATITARTATSLTFTIPYGVQFGTASVTAMNGATASNRNVNFNCTSPPIEYVPVATQLAFTTPSAGATAGTAFTTQPVVEIWDASGIKVEVDTPVTIAIKSGGAMDAKLLGTATVNAVKGVSTFSGLSIDKAGANYVLSAASGTLTAAEQTITVAAAPSTATPAGAITNASIVLDNTAAAAQAKWTVSFTMPSAIPANGKIKVAAPGFSFPATATVMFTAPSATRNDASYANGILTVTLGASPLVAGTVTFTVLGGTNPAAQAALSNVSMKTTTSADMTIAQTTSGTLAAITSAPTSDNVPVPTVTNVFPQLGPLEGGTNIVISGENFDPNTLVKIGGLPVQNELVISATAIAAMTPPTTTAGAKDVVVVNAAGRASTLAGGFEYLTAAPAATQLAFTSSPSGATANTAFTTQPVVEIRDASGNKVDITAPVTIAIKSGGAAGAKLIGTTTVNAVGGVATFSGLLIDKPGADYVLSATSGTLTAAEQTITVAAAATSTAAPAGAITDASIVLDNTAAAAQSKWTVSFKMPSAIPAGGKIKVAAPGFAFATAPNVMFTAPFASSNNASYASGILTVTLSANQFPADFVSFIVQGGTNPAAQPARTDVSMGTYTSADVPIAQTTTGTLPAIGGTAAARGAPAGVTAQAASITLSPSSGAPGTLVTVTGNGFTSQTTLTFNGAAVTRKLVSPTSMTFTVPADAAAGERTVAARIGEAKITSFIPMRGTPGQTVTVTGSGFTSQTKFTVNGEAVLSWTFVSSTSIKLVVPLVLENMRVDRQGVLDLIITATNGEAASREQSAVFTVETAAAGLQCSNAPAITFTSNYDKPLVGSLLTCSNGTWTGDPTSFTYQWLRGSAKIDGATAATYTTTAADLGASLTCEVTASTVVGSSLKASSSAVMPTAVVVLKSKPEHAMANVPGDYTFSVQDANGNDLSEGSIAYSIVWGNGSQYISAISKVTLSRQYSAPGEVEISVSATTKNTRFKLIPSPLKVSLTIEPAPLMVFNNTQTSPGALRTTEAGGKATFTLRPGPKPTSNVHLDLSSSNPAEGTVSPSSIDFTPSNFRKQQTVTITGVDDAVKDGDQTYTINFAITTSDPAFNGKEVAPVSVTNVDDDTAAVASAIQAVDPNTKNVQRLFIAYFGRAGDSAAVANFAKQVSNGASLNSISRTLQSSSEFATLSDDAVQTAIAKIYQNLFGRAIDAAGLAYWNAQIMAGVPLSSVVVALISGATAEDLAALDNKSMVSAAAVAIKLVVSKIPTTATSGTAFATSANSVRIEAKDAADKSVSSATGSVTVSIVDGPQGGAFAAGSTLSAQLAGGEADFTALTLDKDGTYKLKFTSGTLTPAEATVAVSAATTSRGSKALWEFSNLPESFSAGQVFGSTPVITNNSSRTHTVVLSLQSAEGTSVDASALTGTKTVRLAGRGSANLADLAITKPGRYYLVAMEQGNALQAYRSTRIITITVPPAVAIPNAPAGTTLTADPATAKPNDKVTLKLGSTSVEELATYLDALSKLPEAEQKLEVEIVGPDQKALTPRLSVAGIFGGITFEWMVPATAVNGIYTAKVFRSGSPIGAEGAVTVTGGAEAAAKPTITLEPASVAVGGDAKITARLNGSPRPTSTMGRPHIKIFSADNVLLASFFGKQFGADGVSSIMLSEGIPVLTKTAGTYNVHLLLYSQEPSAKTTLTVGAQTSTPAATNGTFTRLQMARLFAEKTCIGSMAVAAVPFTDIADLSQADKDAIGKLYGAGIIPGTSPTTYTPDGSVTREQLALFLARTRKACDGAELPIVKTPFTDIGGRSQTAKDAIARVYGAGLMTGMDGTAFNPSQQATAEMINWSGAARTVAAPAANPYAPYDFGLSLEPEAPKAGEQVRFRIRGPQDLRAEFRDMARGTAPDGIVRISIQGPSRSELAAITKGVLSDSDFLTEAWTVPSNLADGLYTVRGFLGGNPSMADKTFRIGAAPAGGETDSYSFGLEASPTSIAQGGKVDFTLRGDALRNEIGNVSRERAGRSTGVNLVSVEIRGPEGQSVATVAGGSILNDREFQSTGWTAAATAETGAYTAQGFLGDKPVTAAVNFRVANATSNRTVTIVVVSGPVKFTGKNGNDATIPSGGQLAIGQNPPGMKSSPADSRTLQFLQSMPTPVSTAGLVFQTLTGRLNSDGRLVFDFTLSGSGLAKFIETAGGADAVRSSIAISLSDPIGAAPASAPTLVDLSSDKIAFSWTHPSGAPTGRYSARPLLKGAPLGTPEASFLCAYATGTSGEAVAVAKSEEALRAEADAALTALFRPYERENAAEFMTRIHPTFAGTAENLVTLSYSTMQLSIDEDFRNYDEIRFDWTINSVRDFGGGVIEVDATWNERLKTATGSQIGTEVKRSSKTSTFVFRRDATGLLLTTWRGAAAFGLAAPGGILTQQSGSSVPPGDIYVDPSVLNITQNTTFPSDLEFGTGKTYKTVNVSPGVTVTMAAGTAMRLQSGGTMNLGSGATLTGAGWTGVILEGGTLNQQGSLTIDGAVNGIQLATGATPTVTQSGSLTISNFTNRAVLVGSSGSLTLANVSTSGAGTALEAQGGNMTVSSSTIATTGATAATFTGGGTISLSGSTVTGAIAFNSSGAATISNTTITAGGNIIGLTGFTGSLALSSVTLAGSGAASKGLAYVSGSGTVNASSLSTSGSITTPIDLAAAVTGTVNLSGSNTIGGTSTTGISVAGGTIQTSSGSTSVSGAGTGISVGGGTSTLSGLTFSSITTAAIAVSGGTSTFSNSTIAGGATNGVAKTGGAMTLSNCTLSGATGTPLVVSGAGATTLTNTTLTSITGTAATWAGSGSVTLTGASSTGVHSFNTYSGSASFSNTTIKGATTLVGLTNFTGTLGLTSVTLNSTGAPGTAGLGFTSGSGTVNVSSLTTTGTITAGISSAAGVTGTINLAGSNSIGTILLAGIQVAGGTVQTSSGSTSISGAGSACDVSGGTLTLASLTTSLSGAADVSLSAGTVSLSNSTLQGGGPGNATQSGGTLTISNSTISGAFVTAVAVTAGNLTLTSNTITGGLAGRGVDWSSAGTLTMTNGTVRNSGADGISFTAGTVSLSGVTVSSNAGDGIIAGAAGATITNPVISGHAAGGKAGIRVLANATISGGSSNSNDEGIEVANGTAGISGITLSSNTTVGLFVSGAGGTANVVLPAITATLNGSGILGGSGGTLVVQNANIQDNTNFGVNGVPADNISLDNCFISGNNGSVGPTPSVATPTDGAPNPNPQYNNVDAVTNPALAPN